MRSPETKALKQKEADIRFFKKHPDARARKNAYKRDWDERHKERRKQARIEYNIKNRERIAFKRHESKLKEYGLTPEQYEDMLVAQNGVCAICHQAETLKRKKDPNIMRLHVDHCHKTGKVRGLLCTRCNPAIGYLQDDPLRAYAAARYLEQAGTK